MQNNFRTVDKKNEILTLLKQAPPSDRGEIWQTLKDVRHHYKIINIRDDENNKALVIEGPKELEFNPRHPIYVRINHRDLIFKLNPKSFVVYGKRLACPYPNLAKAIDKRGAVRIVLPENRETTVILKPLGAGAAELTVKLLDISKKGIGISISDMNREYLTRNQNFQLKSINDILLAGNHQLEIKYVQRLPKGVIKSGFLLKHPFKDDVFETICKMVFGLS